MSATTSETRPATHNHHDLEGKHPTTIMQPFKFSFRKDKELGTKRPTVELNLPVPTFEGLVLAIKDEGKTRDFILSVLADEVAAVARMQVNDEKEPVNKQEDLDLSNLTLEAIANMPKGERGARGISKETWAEWEKNYIAIMPAITGKTAKQVGNAAKLFVGRLQGAKTAKPVLNLLRNQLDLWLSNVDESTAEEFSEIYTFLTEKLDTFLNTSDEDLTANL